MYNSIWAPKEEGMEKPTKYNRKTSIKKLPNLDANSAFNKFIGTIEKAEFNTGESLNGEIDVGKLRPGKSDFYDALSAMGDPIGALAAEVDKREKANKPGEPLTFKRSPEQDSALKWGKPAAFYVSALRGKDQDKYRRSFSKSILREISPGKVVKKKSKLK